MAIAIQERLISTQEHQRAEHLTLFEIALGENLKREHFGDIPE